MFTWLNAYTPFLQYTGLAGGKRKEKTCRMPWAELKRVMSHTAREDVKVEGGADSVLGPEG